ncbi:hypothetical protein R1flu_028292 [Riccia fluitans]|uniref:Uncharacterized protein n=1 Tax=Riccia fluitans TaxID=41844 RepID=A0ABD1XLR1_9MARC
MVLNVRYGIFVRIWIVAQSVIEKRRKELKLRSDNEKARVSEQELPSEFARTDSDLLSRFIHYDEDAGRGILKDAAAAMSDKYLRDIIDSFVLAGRANPKDREAAAIKLSRVDCELDTAVARITRARNCEKRSLPRRREIGQNRSKNHATREPEGKDRGKSYSRNAAA